MILAITRKTQEDIQPLQNSKHLTSRAGSGDPTSNSLPDRFKSDTRAYTTVHPEYNFKQGIQSQIPVNGLHETGQLQKPTCALVITDARPDNQTISPRSNITPAPRAFQGRTGKPKDVSYIPNPPHRPPPPPAPAGPPSPPTHTSPDRAPSPPEKRTPKPVSGTHVRGSGAVKRSWSVVGRGGRRRSPPSLSEPFLTTVTQHRLHLQQRARWLLGQHSWGASGDLEQVSHWYRLQGGRCRGC